MSQETSHPTTSQIEAAKLLIEMLEEDGEPVDAELRQLAKAVVEPPRPAESAQPSDLLSGSMARAATEFVPTIALSTFLTSFASGGAPTEEAFAAVLKEVAQTERMQKTQLELFHAKAAQMERTFVFHIKDAPEPLTAEEEQIILGGIRETRTFRE